MTDGLPNPPSADPAHAPGAGEEGALLESAAYPPVVRGLAMVIVLALGAFAAWSVPALRGAQWSFASLATFCMAGVLIAWVGWWMVFSRTRFVCTGAGGLLIQTWLWDKRVHTSQVASFKIVHWPWFQSLIAPRILIRHHAGGITWVHSADAALLVAFGKCVVSQGIRGAMDTPP